MSAFFAFVFYFLLQLVGSSPRWTRYGAVAMSSTGKRDRSNLLVLSLLKSNRFRVSRAPLKLLREDGRCTRKFVTCDITVRVLSHCRTSAEMNWKGLQI